MWQDIVWDIDFAQQLLVGFIFLILAISAAILLIPNILRRLQTARDKHLAKALLKEWGGDCIGAMMRLKPIGHTIEIEGYSHYTESGGYGSDFPIFKFWKDIKEGKRNPDGVAMIIYDAFQKTLYSDEEKAMKSIPSLKYPLSIGETAVPTAMIKRVLNPMYAKLEVFELDRLPINELEMAMSYLDTFKELGYMERSTFGSYALHLAQSMEKFAKYLWKLENWSHKAEIKERTENTKTTASTHLSIAIALFALTLISNRLPQIVVGSTSTLFLISSVILFFNNKRTRVIVRRLLSLDVGYLLIFLGLVALTIASFQNNLVTLGYVLFGGAYGFLIISMILKFIKALSYKRNLINK